MWQPNSGMYQVSICYLVVYCMTWTILEILSICKIRIKVDFFLMPNLQNYSIMDCMWHAQNRKMYWTCNIKQNREPFMIILCFDRCINLLTNWLRLCLITTLSTTFTFFQYYNIKTTNYCKPQHEREFPLW